MCGAMQSEDLVGRGLGLVLCLHLFVGGLGGFVFGWVLVVGFGVFFSGGGMGVFLFSLLADLYL